MGLISPKAYVYLTILATAATAGPGPMGLEAHGAGGPVSAEQAIGCFEGMDKAYRWMSDDDITRVCAAGASFEQAYGCFAGMDRRYRWMSDEAITRGCSAQAVTEVEPEEDDDTTTTSPTTSK